MVTEVVSKQYPVRRWMTLCFLAGLVMLGAVYTILMVPIIHEAENSAIVVDEELGDVTMSAAQPTRLRIPALAIDVPFSEPLGVTVEGEIEVPQAYDSVGWYRFGPTPGEVGPAVVLGHVDSYEGPAVFFSLGQLTPGDDIYIDREDGSVAHFIVMELSRHEQSEFPTRAVYGDIPYAGLRLITCTGTYQHSVERYTHNLVVFAKLNTQNKAR